MDNMWKYFIRRYSAPNAGHIRVSLEGLDGGEERRFSLSPTKKQAW